MRLRVGNLLRATVGFVLFLLLSLASCPASAAAFDESVRHGEAVAVPEFNYDETLTVSLRSGEATVRASAPGTDRSEDLGADHRDLDGIYGSSGDLSAPRATSWVDDAATSKVPSGWGAGRPNNKGVGTRWADPANPQANGIRIDQGNPASSLTTQQVDHVVVRSGGRVIGRDGNPISGSIRDNYEMAHIPLDEWLTWSTWNAP